MAKSNMQHNNAMEWNVFPATPIALRSKTLPWQALRSISLLVWVATVVQKVGAGKYRVDIYNTIHHPGSLKGSNTLSRDPVSSGSI